MCAALVVGAGIGGLATARALSAAGWDVEVVERAATWAIEASGISLAPNGVRALASIGLADEVINASHAVQRLTSYSPTGEILFTIGTRPWPGIEHGQYRIDRAALHSALLRGCPVEVRMATTVDAVELDGTEARVQFSDGDVGTYGLVVGAEGVRSPLRSLVAPDAIRRFTGQNYWRGNIEDRCGVDDTTVVATPTSYFGMVPVSERRLSWFGMVASEEPLPRHAGNVAHLVERFGSFGGPVPDVLEAVARGGAVHFGPTESVVCAPWSRGCVALVGDAAHAVSPVTGQGASMAIEDALVLSEELARHHDIVSALSAYEARRRPRTDGLHDIMLRSVTAVTSGAGGGGIEWAKVTAEQLPLLAPPP